MTMPLGFENCIMYPHVFIIMFDTPIILSCPFFLLIDLLLLLFPSSLLLLSRSLLYLFLLCIFLRSLVGCHPLLLLVLMYPFLLLLSPSCVFLLRFFGHFGHFGCRPAISGRHYSLAVSSQPSVRHYSVRLRLPSMLFSCLCLFAEQSLSTLFDCLRSSKPLSPVISIVVRHE